MRHGNTEDTKNRSARQNSMKFGQARLTMTTSLLDIPRDGPTVWFLNPGSITRTVRLPALNPLGGQFYIFTNTSASPTGLMNITSNSGVLVTALARNETCYVVGGDTSWSAGVTSTFSAAQLERPLFFLAMGQSNMVLSDTFAWSPNPLAVKWNNSPGVDGSIGTAFAALASASTNISDVFISEIARLSGTPVNLLNVSFGSQHIGHWLNSVVTFSAATNRVTWPGYYPRNVADSLKFTTVGGTIAAPLVDGTTYFVKNIFDDDSFTLSLTDGGAEIDLTTNGTGTTTGVRVPDGYGNMKANITAALAAAGVSEIDGFLWWQGENQRLATFPGVGPLYYTYESEFEQLIARLRTETFFPTNTPVVVFSIAPSSVAGQGGTPISVAAVNDDIVNLNLARIVQNERDTRMLVYPSHLTGTAGGTYWDASGLHPKGIGYYAYGRAAARQFWEQNTNVALVDPIRKILRGNVFGRPTHRNLITGGDFTVAPWQRNTSVAGGAGASFFFGDRWLWQATAGTGAVTASRQADAPTPAQAGMSTSHCLEILVTANAAAPGGSEAYILIQRILGYEAGFLGFGTSGARPVTVSFWVKSDVPGQYFVTLKNSGLTRANAMPYIIDNAATWEYKTVHFDPDVTGTWQKTTSAGMALGFTLASGIAAFGPNLWAADYYAGQGAVNFMASNNNKFRLALVQLEEGYEASPFEQVPKALVLERCRRHFRKSFPEGTTPAQNAGVGGSLMIVSDAATTFGRSVEWDDSMNITPTVVTFNPSAANANWRDITNAADRTVTVSQISEKGFHLTGASGAAGASNAIHWTAETEPS